MDNLCIYSLEAVANSLELTFSKRKEKLKASITYLKKISLRYIDQLAHLFRDAFLDKVRTDL